MHHFKPSESQIWVQLHSVDQKLQLISIFRGTNNQNLMAIELND